ncbi:MAG: cache domain-containing protein [Rhodospirillum sp.]|nr:cache domain-containing protein [Rhodospirillum sp.]MCF8487667.1 cache domain-containing protein [Rhodospirillum sp.]MCF8500412.1 cache domain-containing protein [Rhodospirillum sp.]
MVHPFTERNLPILQSAGMLVLAALTTFGVGAYVIWSFIDHFEQGLAQTEARAVAVQEALLDNQLTAVANRLDHERSRTESLLREQVRDHTDFAFTIAQRLYDLNKGKMPEDEIKTLIIETLRPLRFFNGRGYYFIDTLDGDCVLLPTVPDLEGTSLWDNQDPTGHYIMRGLVDAVRSPVSEGYSTYKWYPPQMSEMREKIAHVREFKPFNWLIGNGEYTYQIEADLRDAALEEISNIRFGASGYVAILTTDGMMLSSPNNTEVIGVPLSDLPEDIRAVQTAVVAKAKSGGGTIRYRWPRPGESEKIRKLSRVMLYEPWNWILVTGIYMDDMDEFLATQRADLGTYVNSQIKGLSWVMFGVFSISLALSVVFGRWVGRILHAYRSDLEARNRDLAESRNRLKLSAQVFDSSGEAMIITDADNRILAINPAFTRITGYQADEARGRDPKFLESGRHDPSFFRALWKDVIESDGWSGEIWNRRRDGEVFPSWLAINPVRDEIGTITHYIGTLTDITQRKAAEEKIRELAFYDPLTQLPNRRLLRDRLEQAIAASNRTGFHGAVLFIDLDNFKTLNDTRGHDVGDLLLVEVAQRLRHCLRDQDTVARLGGDEFVVVLVHLSRNEADAATQVERVGEKIMLSLNKPYNLAGNRHDITPSIGACLFHWAQESTDTLLRHADTAMYQAKQRGRNRLCFFDPAIQQALMERARLESELRGALGRDEFICLYQPQVDGEGRISGAEVLLRWRHPTLGIVSPLAFIPLAEETGLIVPIGAWILNHACAKLKAWSKLPETAHLTLAVNVSAVQFRESDFITRVERAITSHGIDPHFLKLELTESLVLEDVEGTIGTMKHLKSLGVGFSMDDFGTGQSSLTYLKRLPLDQLKIDQSFVRDIIADPNDAVIVRTIIAMSHSMGLDVLAEGVETADQRDFLMSNGCRKFQGYFFGHPMDIDAFEAKTGLPLLLEDTESRSLER